MKNPVFGGIIVDQRVILRPVEELECCRGFLITGGEIGQYRSRKIDKLRIDLHPLLAGSHFHCLYRIDNPNKAAVVVIHKNYIQFLF